MHTRGIGQNRRNGSISRLCSDQSFAYLENTVTGSIRGLGTARAQSKSLLNSWMREKIPHTISYELGRTKEWVCVPRNTSERSRSCHQIPPSVVIHRSSDWDGSTNGGTRACARASSFPHSPTVVRTIKIMPYCALLSFGTPRNGQYFEAFSKPAL